MSYDAREESTHDAAPVEMYRFISGAKAWRYTSSEEAYAGVDGTYLPEPIKRNAPALSKETSHSTLTLEVSRDFPVAMAFRGGAPGSSIWLTLIRTHRGDGEEETVWQGKVRGVSWTGSRAQLQCDPLDKALVRGTLRMTYGAPCGLRLYGLRCGASESSNTFDATLLTVSADGLTLTAAAFGSQPDGAWVRGEVYHPGLDARRQVVGHVGTSITLGLPLPAGAGEPVKILRGCDHLWLRADGITWGDCVGTFANGLNFGGFPFVPTKNPFKSGLEG